MTVLPPQSPSAVRAVQAFARAAGPDRSESTVTTSAAPLICPLRVGQFASLSWRVASVAEPTSAAGASSPNASRPVFLAPWARRTGRLDYIFHHLGLALGGRPAASFARRLMLQVSNDTLLRVVRSRGSRFFTPPTVVGLDDWAWRRNQRYGTIICDLERRKTIALLPDREPATAEAWLCGQPQISVVARDRGGGYALAVAKALPNAIQVADRWHLMENASRAFLDAVRKSMRQIRTAIGATVINPGVLTAAERIQYEGYIRREEANAAILGLAKDGIAIKEIVRRTGYSRGLVRNVLRGGRSDVFRSRESSLEPYLQWLDAQWDAELRNGAELWRRLKGKGFRGSLRVVTEWATRRRRAEKAEAQSLRQIPSARTVARLLTIGRDTLSKSETITVAAIEDQVPLLVEAREVINDFHAIVRQKSEPRLDPWLAAIDPATFSDKQHSIVQRLIRLSRRKAMKTVIVTMAAQTSIEAP